MSVIETIIDIPAEHEKNVCGQFDAYVKKIERTLHVTIVARDGALKLIGSRVDWLYPAEHSAAEKEPAAQVMPPEYKAADSGGGIVS